MNCNAMKVTGNSSDYLNTINGGCRRNGCMNGDEEQNCTQVTKFRRSVAGHSIWGRKSLFGEYRELFDMFAGTSKKEGAAVARAPSIE